MPPLVNAALDFVRANRQKLIRFVLVSGGAVVIGLAVLAVLVFGVGMPEVSANMLAAAIMVMPNYLANRYWVWGKRSKNSFRTEVLPFWLIAILGFVVSTAAVAVVVHLGWPRWSVLFANVSSYGVVWVFKFFVLERYLFGSSSLVPSSGNGIVTS